MMAYDGNLYFTNSTSPDWVTYTTTYNIYDAKSKAGFYLESRKSQLR